MKFEQRVWWVITGKLAGMPRPTVEEIAELKDAGICAVVSLTEDDTNLAEYEQAGLESLWLPVEDGEAPSTDQVRLFAEFVDRMQQEDKAVAVHCLGGNGRAGTLLTSYLIQHGQTPAAAIAGIRSINSKAIQTETQEQFLVSLG